MVETRLYLTLKFLSVDAKNEEEEEEKRGIYRLRLRSDLGAEFKVHVLRILLFTFLHASHILHKVGREGSDNRGTITRQAGFLRYFFLDAAFSTRPLWITRPLSTLRHCPIHHNTYRNKYASFALPPPTFFFRFLCHGLFVLCHQTRSSHHIKSTYFILESSLKMTMMTTFKAGLPRLPPRDTVSHPCCFNRTERILLTFFFPGCPSHSSLLSPLVGWCHQESFPYSR